MAPLPAIPLSDSASSDSRLPVMEKGRIPAWLLSFFLHGLLFVVFLMCFKVTDRGAAEEANRTGGIVLVEATADATEYLTEGDVLEANDPAAADVSPAPLTASAERPPDLPELAGLDSRVAPEMGTGDLLAQQLPGADSLIEGPVLDLKIGGAVTTEVFGIKGTGSRFVYVFDRSQSMEGYQKKPLLAARRELLQSLESLGSKHQFQIIFYNDNVTLFKSGSPNAMHFATDEIKIAATEFVNGIRGDHGTDHLRALKRALRLGPDVVFLLTDAEGGFTAGELREVGDANRSGAIINAIEFGEMRGRDGSLQTLARQNGGTYLFKDIRSLNVKQRN